jgi:hypothetical protein
MCLLRDLWKFLRKKVIEFEDYNLPPKKTRDILNNRDGDGLLPFKHETLFIEPMSILRNVHWRFVMGILIHHLWHDQE